MCVRDKCGRRWKINAGKDLATYMFLKTGCVVNKIPPLIFAMHLLNLFHIHLLCRDWLSSNIVIYFLPAPMYLYEKWVPTFPPLLGHFTLLSLPNWASVLLPRVSAAIHEQPWQSASSQACLDHTDQGGPNGFPSSGARARQHADSRVHLTISLASKATLGTILWVCVCLRHHWSILAQLLGSMGAEIWPQTPWDRIFLQQGIDLGNMPHL